ncbi:MAG: hypothetical protein ACHP65_00395 [Legionellales bacterium]
MRIFCRLFLMLIMLSSTLWASITPSPWYTQDSDKNVSINVELFLSSTCPHCHKMDAYFRKIEPKTPWLHVQRFIINEDKAALIRFNELLTEDNSADFVVPSAYFCNSRWVGFTTGSTTGKDLLHALNYCKNQIESKGALTPTTASVLKRWAHANIYATGLVGNPTAAYYITAMAVIDSYNPCALFCLMCFLALLFIQESHKSQLMCGFIFILTVGAVHYLQQAHTNTFFELLSWLRWPSALIGATTWYVTAQHYRRHSTCCWWFLLSFLLAFVIQCYQQTCLTNWSYIFQQWLYDQSLSKGQIALYELIYQGLYVLTLVLTLIAYTLLIKAKRCLRFKERLNTFGILTLMTVALILIIYPLGLSYFVLSCCILVLLVISVWFLNRWHRVRGC